MRITSESWVDLGFKLAERPMRAAGTLVALWCVALNPRVDGVMCAAIGGLLARSGGFGARAPMRLLQLPDGHGVTRILVHAGSPFADKPVAALASSEVLILALERADGTFLSIPRSDEVMQTSDVVFVYAADRTAHELAEMVATDD